MKKKILAGCLAVVLLLGLHKDSHAATTMEAIPTNVGAIYAKAVGSVREESISSRIPIYAIQQSNGYYSNYMKLRDIAYYLDFDVVWDAAEPNAMRLYTNRHYLDNWTAPGPATVAKEATESNMDIYIDDVKVRTAVQPVMIEYNNYFKVRDIAQLIDFWCEFGTTQGYTFVRLDYNYRYADETAIAAGATRDAKYAKTVDYQPIAWYGGDSGKVSSTPVTYSVRDAWGNVDYTKLYFGETDTDLNALAQLMLDRKTIAKDSSGVAQFGDGNKLNAYYRYPLVQYQLGNTQNDAVIRKLATQRGATHSTNFGTNIAIRPLNRNDLHSENQVGVLSIEYNDDSLTAQSRIATQKYAAHILAEMNTLSCDAEKIQYLGWVTTKKLIYADKKASELTAAEKQKGGIRAGTEVADLPTERDWDAWAKIWADDKVYVGVCDHYCTVFEGLCNAAGYYFVADVEGKRNHVADLVWVPDEGRWLGVDCSSADSSSGNGENYSGASIAGAMNNEQARSDDGEWRVFPTYPLGLQNNSRILDFFYMMEQIKPGGWLSSDPKLNP